MKKYIMAMDQGTTSSRCIIFNRKGEILSLARKEYPQHFPKPGWVEHNPKDIANTQIAVAKEALKKLGITAEDVAGIGITNQRETTIVWDKNTGEPVYNAIVWQCRRTSEYADFLKDAGYEDMIRSKTGLTIDAYFSGTKLKWILDNVKGAGRKAKEGDLLFGTVETWLIWNLTGGKVHVTDYSNASRTMLFNIHTLKWDDDILELLNIPKNMLPTPCGCSEVYVVSDASIFGTEIPIAGAAGDQQAALFGQACFEPGMSKMTYGTGGFMLLNTGHEVKTSESGLLSTIAWGLDGKINYALEGSVFVAGAAMQWLRDELNLLDDSAKSEAMANSVSDTGGVIVIPAFVGLGAPYWDQYVRGGIFGITRGTNKSHIVRATLESLAYQTRDLVDAMEEDMGREITFLKVDGGASGNNFLLQFQADILGKECIRPKMVETTALGAAYLAGLAVGFWKNKDDVVANVRIDRRFSPNIDEGKRAMLLETWHRGIDAVRRF